MNTKTMFSSRVVVKAKNKNIPLHRKVELMHAMIRSLSRYTRIGE